VIRNTSGRGALEGLQRKVGAALHVIHAGAVEPVADKPHGQVALQRPDGMHGVEMSQHEPAGRVTARSGAQDQRVAKPLPARHALHRDRRIGDLGRNEIHHAVDAVRAIGRALDAGPSRDRLDHAGLIRM
jgi:hypothetical protein